MPTDTEIIVTALNQLLENMQRTTEALRVWSVTWSQTPDEGVTDDS